MNNLLLFTGASGFIGNNILPNIKKTFHVDTLGKSNKNFYKYDLSREIPILTKRYNIILHAAGMAHNISKTKDQIEKIYNVNYIGTKNLCASLEKVGIPEAFIFISSVSVYGCVYGELINEDYPLLGKSPYAKSKIMAEKYLQEWSKKNNVTLTIIRPSLLAGKNPKGNLGYMVKAISRGLYFSIDGGKARKSIAMVEDIARIIPLCIYKGGIYNLCDDYNPTIREIENTIAKQLEKKILINIPINIANAMAKLGDILGPYAPLNSEKLIKLTNSLTFSNEKIKRQLNFQPLDVLSNFKIK